MATSQQSVVLLPAKLSQKPGAPQLWIEENMPFDRWLREQLLLCSMGSI